MTSPQHMLETLREWEELSRLEGQAIEQDDWRQVGKCQQAKTVLRDQIEAVRAAMGDIGGMRDVAAWPKPVRDALARLISMERENAERVASRRAAAESKWAELETAAVNLRRVQRSYVHPAQSSWTSYS